MCCRSAGPAIDSGVEEPPAENAERVQAAAVLAYDVLREWSHVPGAEDDSMREAGDWRQTRSRTVFKKPLTGGRCPMPSSPPPAEGTSCLCLEESLNDLMACKQQAPRQAR